jgi:putative transposase
MIRIQLDDPLRNELQALRRQNLPPKVRDRLEMVLLCAAGWSAPRIAAHLGYCGHTVRAILHGFQQRGRDALYPKKTGPAPDQERSQQVTGLLRDLLGEERTWTSRQLGAALEPRGVSLGARQVRRYLKLLKAGYHRTAATVRHKQDSAKVARAQQVLDGLKKKRGPAG